MKLWHLHFSCICPRRQGSSPCMASTFCHHRRILAAQRAGLCAVAAPLGGGRSHSWIGVPTSYPAFTPPARGEGAAWKACRMIELTKSFRSKDPSFLQTLELLRSSMPTKVQLNAICRGRKAWVGAEPSAADLARLLAANPEATFVAATRRGVALINRLALEALHPHEAPLATLPGTYEDNPDNYRGSHLREDRLPLPAEVPIWAPASS